MLSKTELKRIKKWLPDGFIKVIAEKTEFSESLVEKFFAGAKYNRSIHECALKIAEQHKSELDELKERTNAL